MKNVSRTNDTVPGNGNNVSGFQYKRFWSLMWTYNVNVWSYFDAASSKESSGSSQNTMQAQSIYWEASEASHMNL